MDDVQQSTIAWYDENARQYADQTEPMQSELEKFMALLPQGGAVVDAGCGSGLDTHLMSQQGFNAVGLDLSAGLLREARKRYPRAQFVHGDLLHLPFADASMDGVWAKASLLHLASLHDAHLAMAEFSRVLKKGGSLFVLVKADSGENDVPVITTDSAHQRHFLYFTQDQIEELFRTAGLRITGCEQYPETAKRPHGRPGVEVIEVWGIKVG